MDPRLNALTAYVSAEMPNGTGQGPLAALNHDVAALQRRVDALERAHVDPIVMRGAGPPTFAAPQDGTLYIDSTNLRLYARVNSAWRYLGPFT